ncbi:NUDIX hydrolase family protein [Pigmentiphaga sp.]|jgi:Isopentenyldiphosphate isomerase|uniref:NUDIX hydrolase n=1 Tax=Pigmentiphaga sp. TaxID=1977564 RepID=UPI0025CF4F00|nr:DUF4743 domain-containing protein [Pigmentiphaga sp.]MBX6318925.1 DUF4743 domain-containing protein [Pigmentiphaga sp.]
MNVFDSILTRAHVDPPPDFPRLRIAGRDCGWVAADVLQWLAPFAGEIRVDPGVVHLLPGWDGSGDLPERTAAVNDLLSRIAQALSQAGRLNGWRNELLDVIADDGTVLGVIERAAVRPLGIATHAVHLNAWTDNGQLWIAQRSFTKTTDPGMWDTLVGGLISAGETPESALLRESWEEAGLLPHHLQSGRRSGQFSVRRILPEGYQIEHVTVVDIVLGPEVVPENQDGEVAALKTASPQEVLQMIADGAFTLEAALAMRASLGAYVQPAVAAASEDMAPEAARLSF